MKHIVSSVSDVITNSSSEVYVMNKRSAYYIAGHPDTYDCIGLTEIDWDWILGQGCWEDEMISHITGLKTPSYKSTKDEWTEFCEKNREVLEKELVGKYFVDIEDHFPDCDEVMSEARAEAEWYDNRH